MIALFHRICRTAICRSGAALLIAIGPGLAESEATFDKRLNSVQSIDPHLDQAELEKMAEIKDLFNEPCVAGIRTIGSDKVGCISRDRRSVRIIGKGNLAFYLASAQSYLGRISIWHTNIKDISPIRRLRTLDELMIASSPVSDLEPIGELEELRKLTLRITAVRDISPLAEINSLRSLDITASEVADIGPISAHTRLEVLQLRGTNIEDLSPLGDLTALTELSLSMAKATDIGPLAGLRNLRRLSIRGLKVEDLSSLSGLRHLHFLWAPDGSKVGNMWTANDVNREAVAAYIAANSSNTGD